MLMQELGRILQEDPNLCAMAMADKRKYIISKWNASHSDPIDEDAVALFLCDENRGDLTDEQRAFAKERCAEFEFCNQITVYRLLQCGEMIRQHLVSGPAEYFRIFLPQCAVPCGRGIPFAAACEALCALPSRQGRVPCPTWGFQGGFGPISGQTSGRGPRGTKSRRNCRGHVPLGRDTTARSAGSFGDGRGRSKTKISSLGVLPAQNHESQENSGRSYEKKEVSKHGYRKREICPLDHARG